MPSDDALSEADRCYAAAMRILNYRWNGRAELRRKLARKPFEPEVIDGTLDRLTGEGWLDDERFAAAFVRDRARKRIGRRRIVAELKSTGLGDDEARRAVEQNVDKESEERELRALCQKKMRIMARRDGPEFPGSDEGRNKLLMYLLSHGYEMTASRDAVRECIRSAAGGDE